MKSFFSVLSICSWGFFFLGCSAYTSAGRKDFEKAYSNAGGQILTSSKVQATSCHIQLAPSEIDSQSLHPEKTYQVRHLSSTEIEICELTPVDEENPNSQ